MSVQWPVRVRWLLGDGRGRRVWGGRGIGDEAGGTVAAERDEGAGAWNETSKGLGSSLRREAWDARSAAVRGSGEAKDESEGDGEGVVMVRWG